MKPKIIIISIVFFLLTIALPVKAETALPPASENLPVKESLPQEVVLPKGEDNLLQKQAQESLPENIPVKEPLKNYNLLILPETARQTIKLNPPATAITVKIEPGDIALPCGDNFKTYTCTAGKPLKINRDLETPVTKFWVQNSAQKNARLKIIVDE
ncbi:MAG: hypothetical protein WA999_21205 [Spirulinaceae cyanobacterium]